MLLLNCLKSNNYNNTIIIHWNASLSDYFKQIATNTLLSSQSSDNVHESVREKQLVSRKAGKGSMAIKKIIEKKT